MKLRSIILFMSIALTSLISAFGQADIVSKDPKITKDFLSASSKFMEGDYKGSIPLYKKVLKQDSLLSKNYWYVLIDNLGMAYGITGDNKSSEGVFKYGLSKDSKYPMFYYNLACVAAQQNDMKGSIDYLKSAYKYKNNMLEGEPFPDPATDDSFQKYMKNDTFLSALKELQKQ